MLAKVRPSLWFYSRFFIVAVLLIGFGIRILYVARSGWQIAFALIAAGVLMIIAGILARRTVSWNVTSDRIVEKRGLLASHRREMELADIRSIEVSQRALQRLLGLGSVTIASAASADFMIRMTDIANPNQIAEMVRQARLKRLA